MKIYARQVAPEYQESPLYLYNEFPDNIAVCGNRDCNEHMPTVFKRVYEALENGQLAEAIKDFETGGFYSEFYENVTSAINILLYAEKKRYSTRDIHALKKLAVDYCWAAGKRADDILCEVLAVVTGKKWAKKTIRGCSQSDWNDVFFPIDEWNTKKFARFVSEYFNMGSEWVIDGGDFDPEKNTPNDISGYYMYATGWDTNDIKSEIAEAEGVSFEDVVLYYFDGCLRIPRYKDAC